MSLRCNSNATCAPSKAASRNKRMAVNPSTLQSGEKTIPTRLPFKKLTARAIASSHDTSINADPSRTFGDSRRLSERNASYTKRPRSHIHGSTPSLAGRIRITSSLRDSISISQPCGHCVHVLLCLIISQGRDTSWEGLSSNAPTGQISGKFPESSEAKASSTTPSINIWSPRLSTPISPVPAISSANRTHRVQ